MKKKHALQPLEMTNFLTKADPDIWGQLYDKDGQASAEYENIVTIHKVK